MRVHFIFLSCDDNHRVYNDAGTAAQDGTPSQYFHATEIYGTPLNTGLIIGRATGIPRFDRIHFAPDYWANSRISSIVLQHEQQQQQQQQLLLDQDGPPVAYNLPPTRVALLEFLTQTVGGGGGGGGGGGVGAIGVLSMTQSSMSTLECVGYHTCIKLDELGAQPARNYDLPNDGSIPFRHVVDLEHEMDEPFRSLGEEEMPAASIRLYDLVVRVTMLSPSTSHSNPHPLGLWSTCLFPIPSIREWWVIPLSVLSRGCILLRSHLC